MELVKIEPKHLGIGMYQVCRVDIKEKDFFLGEGESLTVEK